MDSHWINDPSAKECAQKTCGSTNSGLVV